MDIVDAFNILDKKHKAIQHELTEAIGNRIFAQNRPQFYSQEHILKYQNIERLLTEESEAMGVILDFVRVSLGPESV